MWCASPLGLDTSPCGLGDPPGWVAPPGGPPGPLRWSRDTPGDPRSSPDGRNWSSYISFFTSGPSRNSS